MGYHQVCISVSISNVVFAFEVHDFLQSISLAQWHLVLEIPCALFHLYFRLGRGNIGIRTLFLH